MATLAISGRQASRPERPARRARGSRAAWRALPVLLLVAAVALLPPLAGCGKPSAGKAQQYYCPMHPTYVSNKPGECPICGMDLVPAEKPDSAEKKSTGGAGSGPSGAGATPGYAPVVASQEGISLAGVQTVMAALGSLSRDIRTVGLVSADETRTRVIHARIDGWVEKLFVNATGQLVHRGDPLLTLYSPELLASQEEYLRTREAAARFAASELPEVRRGGEELLAAARRRLELFEVPERFIEEMERTGAARRTVTLEAPTGGFVTARGVYEGARIEPGTELFTLTDLSRVWIEAEVFEQEAAAVRVGQEARISLPYDPAAARAGRVGLIVPTLNADTRTLRVRFDLDNPDGSLKPGMYVNVSLRVEGGMGVHIPDSAILDTGERQLVFVETEAGRFEPRRVTVGQRSEGYAQILTGVAAGERVVARAAFLLDSESRLQAALAGAGAHGSPAVAPAGAGAPADGSGAPR